MRGARFIVVPSQCYENFPRIVVEAYGFSKPIIASRLGSLAEIVDDQKTGLLFSAGDEKDLADKVCWLNERGEIIEAMSKNAKEKYDSCFSSKKNVDRLIEIYQQVINRKAVKTYV